VLASEVIAKLTDLIITHGDLEVENDRSELSLDVEYNTEDGICFLITFE